MNKRCGGPFDTRVIPESYDRLEVAEFSARALLLAGRLGAVPALLSHWVELCLFLLCYVKLL